MNNDTCSLLLQKRLLGSSASDSSFSPENISWCTLGKFFGRHPSVQYYQAPPRATSTGRRRLTFHLANVSAKKMSPLLLSSLFSSSRLLCTSISRLCVFTCHHPPAVLAAPPTSLMIPRWEKQEITGKAHGNRKSNRSLFTSRNGKAARGTDGVARPGCAAIVLSILRRAGGGCSE